MERSKELGMSFEGLEQLKKQALDHIEKNGPVCSDKLPIKGKIYWHSSMHWSGNWDKESLAARSVLEQLYTDGELVIHHKTGADGSMVVPYELKEILVEVKPEDKPAASAPNWRQRKKP